MALPSPQEVRATFTSLRVNDPEQALSYLHGLGVSSGYLQQEAGCKSIRWVNASPYGSLECTINLDKPEKDPRDIAQAYAVSNTIPHRLSPQGTKPQCDLCWENEEFPGTPEHPAKPGLRIAAIPLGSECWGLQYSPYAYFAEHCIALSREHRPMKIDESCFERLFDFVDCFPAYFVGSNADLPIVGGSILSHDHFQGGRHEFPLMRAPIVRNISLEGLAEVQCGIVKWPASVLRLLSQDRAALLKAAARVLCTWRTYSNAACNITAFTSAQHNTLNPIARKTQQGYILDLALRNNLSDDQHPWGIFHPGEALHHIKKENIGLIEIMGMAILPPRLATELPFVQDKLISAARQGLAPIDLKTLLAANPATASHAPWATDIYLRRAVELAEAHSHAPQHSPCPATIDSPVTKASDLHTIIKQEISAVFVSILETTGVFKHTSVGAAGWDSFISKLS